MSNKSRNKGTLITFHVNDEQLSKINDMAKAFDGNVSKALRTLVDKTTIRKVVAEVTELDPGGFCAEVRA